MVYSTNKSLRQPWSFALHIFKPLCSRLQDIHGVITTGAQPGEAFGPYAPFDNFKTLHRNFDICRNFQMIKMKFCNLIVFKKVLFQFFFVLLLNYLLTRFILGQATWLKISQLEVSKLGRSFKCWYFCDIFYPFVRIPLWKFSEMQCVYALILFRIFWGREFSCTFETLAINTVLFTHQ